MNLKNFYVFIYNDLCILQVEKLMDNKPYIIETKFDGERILLHKQDGEYKYFSRR